MCPTGSSEDPVEGNVLAFQQRSERRWREGEVIPCRHEAGRMLMSNDITVDRNQEPGSPTSKGSVLLAVCGATRDGFCTLIQPASREFPVYQKHQNK